MHHMLRAALYRRNIHHTNNISPLYFSAMPRSLVTSAYLDTFGFNLVRAHNRSTKSLFINSSFDSYRTTRTHIHWIGSPIHTIHTMAKQRELHFDDFGDLELTQWSNWTLALIPNPDYKDMGDMSQAAHISSQATQSIDPRLTDPHGDSHGDYHGDHTKPLTRAEAKIQGIDISTLAKEAMASQTGKRPSLSRLERARRRKAESVFIRMDQNLTEAALPHDRGIYEMAISKPGLLPADVKSDRDLVVVYVGKCEHQKRRHQVSDNWSYGGTLRSRIFSGYGANGSHKCQELTTLLKMGFSVWFRWHLLPLQTDCVRLEHELLQRYDYALNSHSKEGRQRLIREILVYKRSSPCTSPHASWSDMTEAEEAEKALAQQQSQSNGQSSGHANGHTSGPATNGHTKHKAKQAVSLVQEHLDVQARKHKQQLYNQFQQLSDMDCQLLEQIRMIYKQFLPRLSLDVLNWYIQLQEPEGSTLGIDQALLVQPVKRQPLYDTDMAITNTESNGKTEGGQANDQAKDKTIEDAELTTEPNKEQSGWSTVTTRAASRRSSRKAATVTTSANANTSIKTTATDNVFTEAAQSVDKQQSNDGVAATPKAMDPDSAAPRTKPSAYDYTRRSVRVTRERAKPDYSSTRRF